MRFLERAEERKSGRRGGKKREDGPEFKQPCAGSKMATDKAGDRWSLPDVELEKWGKKNEKINTITVRNLKINQKPIR